jgi:site-specific recombinase XerD
VNGFRPRSAGFTLYGDMIPIIPIHILPSAMVRSNSTMQSVSCPRKTGNALPQANAYAMIRRRALAAEITTKIGNHTFRATGVTAYLKNGGTLEKAAQMVNHASTRTTQLYDRRAEEVTLVEVERILV